MTQGWGRMIHKKIVIFLLFDLDFGSPLSNSQEVSAFGEDGEGDTGDVWKVVCEGDFWRRDDIVMFKHSDTGVFLGASGHTFGRPIHGQMEIVGLSMPDVSAK